MISKILKIMRIENKLTQKQLAKKVGIQRSTLSGYETEYSHPDFEAIEKIADSCNFEIVFRNKITKEEYTKNNIDRKEV